MRISDWSSDVCSSDLFRPAARAVGDDVECECVDLAFAGVAVNRDQMVADVVAAVAHVRERAFEKIHVLLGRAVEGIAVRVGGVARIQRAQQCAVLAVDAARIQQREFADRVLGEQRSEEHTSELQSLMRSSYAVFCLKKTKKN